MQAAHYSPGEIKGHNFYKDGLVLRETQNRSGESTKNDNKRGKQDLR